MRTEFVNFRFGKYVCSFKILGNCVRTDVSEINPVRLHVSIQIMSTQMFQKSTPVRVYVSIQFVSAQMFQKSTPVRLYVSIQIVSARMFQRSNLSKSIVSAQMFQINPAQIRSVRSD